MELHTLQEAYLARQGQCALTLSMKLLATGLSYTGTEKRALECCALNCIRDWGASYIFTLVYFVA